MSQVDAGVSYSLSLESLDHSLIEMKGSQIKDLHWSTNTGEEQPFIKSGESAGK